MNNIIIKYDQLQMHARCVSLDAYVASLGQQATAVQMRCHSEFLQQLRELMSSGAPRYYYVLSRLDNMIFPWQSAELQAPSRAGTLILDCSHQGLLHHRLVCEMLVVWLLAMVD